MVVRHLRNISWQVEPKWQKCSACTQEDQDQHLEFCFAKTVGLFDKRGLRKGTGAAGNKEERAERKRLRDKSGGKQRAQLD